MKFQRIIEFGQISLKLKGELRSSLEKSIHEIKLGLKEILMLDYMEVDGQRFDFKDQQEMDSNELSKIRKETYASVQYDDQYLIIDGEEITMDENMIHSFYGKNGFFIGLNQMNSNEGNLVYLDANCNSIVELELIKEVCNKHFSFLGLNSVIELVKGRKLLHHIYLFIISIESSSHTSLTRT